MRRARGFTLIELMVVVVIIGVILTFAVLAIGDGGLRDKVELEARRLTALLDLAGDEAILNGRELGLYLEQDGYRFLLLTPDGWRPPDDNLLRARQLPPGLALGLVLEGLPVELEPPPKDKALKPHLFLTSSGERMPPFEVQVGPADAFGLAEEGPRFRIVGPLIGDLKFEPLPSSS